MLLIKVDIYVVLLVFFCIRKWLFTWVDRLISDLRICSHSSFFFVVVFARAWAVRVEIPVQLGSIGPGPAWRLKPRSWSSSAPNWEPSGHLLSRGNLCWCNFFFFFFFVNLTPYGIDLRFQFVLWKLGNDVCVCVYGGQSSWCYLLQFSQSEKKKLLML